MKKLLICNHKMFLTYDEAKELKDKMDDINFDNIDLIVCPGYLNLNLYDGYKLGAQDCFYEDKGAFTGEVSAYFLSLRGVKYSLVGHCERRKYDTNETVGLKVNAALRNMITPIVCVGENKMDKELKRTSTVIKSQLKGAFEKITDPNEEVIIAYEPFWAIGSNSCLSISEIEDTFTYIKKILKGLNITNYKLVYGGSITKENIKKILSSKIDGYLIGSASININELKDIVKCINSVN